MVPFRVQVKYFVEKPEDVDLGAFIGLFQRWIQQKAIGGQLIDVADYRHVFEGPGIVLIGNEGDYSMEIGHRGLGVLYTRKHQLDSNLQQQLRVSFQQALTACRLLETDPAVKLTFRTNEAEVRILDRLILPNSDESLEQVQDDLKAVLADVYGDTATSIARINDNPREVFTIGVRAEGAPDVATLLERLQLSVAKES
jgi:hypothetical protein